MNGNIFTKMSHSRLGEASNFGYPLGFRKNHAVTNSIEVQNTRVKLPSLRSIFFDESNNYRPEKLYGVETDVAKRVAVIGNRQ